MKVMSRDFTTAEKILLVLLVVVLLGLGYYYFVDQPVRSTVSSHDAETSALPTPFLRQFNDTNKSCKSAASTLSE